MVAKGNFGRVKDSVSFGPSSSRRRIILLEGQGIVARSKEILVTQRERGLFLIPNKLCKACAPDDPTKGGFRRQNYGCILLCLLSIIDDYHYGSTLVVHHVDA